MDVEEQKDGGEEGEEEEAVKKVSSITCQRRFFVIFSCLEMSFRPADVCATLCCFGIFLFHVILVVKHKQINAATFPDEQLECQKQAHQSNLQQLFSFSLWLFVEISHVIFGTTLLLKCCF